MLFRSEKKYIGSNERKFISELVFLALRIKALADFCIKMDTNPKLNSQNIDDRKSLMTIISTFVLSGLEDLKFTIDSKEVIQKLNSNKNIDLNNLAIESISQLLNIDIQQVKILTDEIFKNYKLICNKSNLIIEKKLIIDEEDWDILENRLSFPKWILKSLLKSNPSISSTSELAALATSMLSPAPVCLRINEIATTREFIINILKSHSLNPEPSTISPSGIILDKRFNLQNLDLLKSGLIEVQDTGSQLISYIVAPEKGWKILDACAGAGGKTLHLATLQQDKGKIIASDIEPQKLKELNFRAKRFGFKSISTVRNYLNNNEVYKNDVFDAVLVDAPCSGSGTLRRMPMAKWRLTPKLLNKLSENQFNILSMSSKFVKVGGVLVYATCSIFGEENDLVVDRFLKSNENFEPEPMINAFNKYRINSIAISDDAYKLQLLPSVHKTDGFFAARMIRTS